MILLCHIPLIALPDLFVKVGHVVNRRLAIKRIHLTVILASDTYKEASRRTSTLLPELPPCVEMCVSTWIPSTLRPPIVFPPLIPRPRPATKLTPRSTLPALRYARSFGINERLPPTWVGPGWVPVERSWDVMRSVRISLRMLSV